MAIIDGKFNLLQEQAFNSLAPDNEISRIRMIELMNFLNREAYQIGDVIESTLTYEQFRLVFNDTWTTMSGQSIITTDLGQKKSINFLPDLVGTKGAIGQAGDDTELGLQDDGQNKYHFHRFVKGRSDSDESTSDAGFNLDSDSNPITNANQALADYYIFDNGIGNLFFIKRQFNNPSDGQPLEPVYGNSGIGGNNFKPNSIATNIFIKVNESRAFND